ncbi:GLOBIN domain-containing protein [Aphelenchoides bicaudatus]|nr:GLOBIN domain-containing protein [Aphelenchoides bicaudatus]
MEAACNGFHAARQRYKKRRTSRAAATSADGAQRWRISSKISSRELPLNEEQCEQLSDAFINIPDKYYAFEQMFLQLLQDDPQIAIVFGFDGIKPEELRRMSPFRTHICKFQRFMTTVLDMLPKRNREQELIQILRHVSTEMVGRQHCNVKQLSFTASKWLSFKNAMLKTLAVNGEQDKNYSSWNLLISFMIYELKDAYLAHIRQIRSNSLPHVLEAYKLEFHKNPEATPEAEPDTTSTQSAL